MTQVQTGLWTEHCDEPDWEQGPPVSSEISALAAGCRLVSSEEGPTHWILRHVGTYAECRAALDLYLQEAPWGAKQPPLPVYPATPRVPIGRITHSVRPPITFEDEE